MKKLTLSALVLTALFGANAHANNTITFLGEVSDQTCEVAINGATANPTVLLPTVSTADLATAGSVAGETPFTLSVSGCTINATQALPIKTVFVGNSVTAAGNLGNTGTATNVSLQILDAVGGNAVDLTGVATVDGLNVAAGDSTASHDFAVQYYAEGAATAGTVVSSVQYAISYL
ncbi:fimbrial protein [Shewanella xiamenensis]|uniref:fimbrial protein n=1 Tax=Shewanella xiamenensis TaxID=332186 RepID=UPI0016639A20|nr:fimbrial protein [Shewanella xiamenensis]MCL1070959.1 type 1 fimbrial protein [Shewanella xiamenensis]MEE1980857.1 fimbrial protein [Shewanella xiamenensis]GGM90398.1 fimbrial protein [Shewanella xiamenensis]